MGFLYFFICCIIFLIIFLIWLSRRTLLKFDNEEEELNRMCQKRAEMFADFLETQKQMKPIIDAKFKRDAERLMKLVDKCSSEESKAVEKKCKDFLLALDKLASEYEVSIIRHKRDWDDTILVDFDLTPKGKDYLLKNKGTEEGCKS